MTNYYIPIEDPDSADSEPVLVSSLRASVVRTAVPVIVGAVVTVVYYAIVRTLETRVGPAFGWLLGVARVPQYPA